MGYHIPLAKDILLGNFTHYTLWGEYYPGMGEVLLAGFMALHIPLNLFNLLGWALLVRMCYLLGKHFGLNSNLAIIFAISIGLINSVVRLISTQTIDIWLAVFYFWTILLLEKPQKTFKYALLVGISLGCLVGTKYSGPLFLLPLFIVYGPRFMKNFLPKYLLGLIPFILFGASWYLRNWALKGTPIYPNASAEFHLLNWQLWKTPLLTVNGTFLLIQALVSEYLIWCFAPIVSLKSQFSSLKFLGWANLLVCMFLPTWPENIISDLRYTYVAFIPLILLTFLYFQKKNWSEKISLLAILTMLSVIPQLDYFPKLFFILAVSLLFLPPKQVFKAE